MKLGPVSNVFFFAPKISSDIIKEVKKKGEEEREREQKQKNHTSLFDKSQKAQKQ